MLLEPLMTTGIAMVSVRVSVRVGVGVRVTIRNGVSVRARVRFAFCIWG